MSTPVVAEKWAGNFDCDACRRKRLMGSEFSKKALERYRRDGGPLKCKLCVAKAEEDEREKAAAKRQTSKPSEPVGEKAASSDKRVCAACSNELDQSAFNRNQWSKGDGKSRCRDCVERALKEEADQQNQSKQDKVELAKQNIEKAKASGNALEILKAESALAALEAEKVTGLKPVKLGGRGRGRSGAGSGRGRGRGGRGQKR